MQTLCVILARAGSKGLPGKNTRLLGGKPLVAWSIEHARACRSIDRVVLSTDGREIAAVGDQYGIEVIDRPPELAGDTAPVGDAVRHAVETCEAQADGRYDVAVVLYGNVPLRPADLTDRAIVKLISTNAHSVQSVCPVGKFHPYWMKTLGGADHDAILAYQPNRIDRRQDLPPVYQLDGGVIVVRRDPLFSTTSQGPHGFLGSDQRAVVTEPGQVVDVDTARDLSFAQALIGASPDDDNKQTGGSMTIAGQPVDKTYPVYVIAELGVNHDGDVDRALELVHAAKQAGADAVKLQFFDPALLLSEEAGLAGYQRDSSNNAFEMLAGLKLDIEEMQRVRSLAGQLGLGFIVTCFSLELVESTRRLEVDAVKVASPDAVNLPLVERLLTLDKPMLISTGACGLEELEPVVGMCRGRPFGLLQCVSAYPTPKGQAALRGIDALRGLAPVVGYSDHSDASQVETGMLAAACGANVIEKHLTYDRQAKGPDHAASLDPQLFKRYVDLIRLAQQQLGPPGKGLLECERDVRRVSRQSVCATRDLPAGHKISRDDVTVKRPGTGIPAAGLSRVVGRSLRRAVAKNHLLHEEDLEP